MSPPLDRRLIDHAAKAAERAYDRIIEKGGAKTIRRAEVVEIIRGATLSSVFESVVAVHEEMQRTESKDFDLRGNLRDVKKKIESILLEEA